MGLKYFDFDCSKCESTFEDLVEPDVKNLPCPTCGANSVRLIACPRIDYMRMGVDPGFPGAYEKWAKVKTQHHIKGKETMHGGKGTSLLMY